MIEYALQYIHANFAKPIKIEELCEIAKMSRTKFYLAFEKTTKKKPIEYIKDLRLEEANRLLRTSKIYVASAAYRVGYASSAHFSRDYKRKYQVVPSEIAARRTERCDSCLC